MTDTKKINDVITNSGLKKTFIAKKINLSHQALYNKLNGKTEFTLSEITALCGLLNISTKKRDEIFFANAVD